MRRTLIGIALIVLTVTCRGTSPSSEEILVFAAASLTDVFNEMKAGFERAREAPTVRFNFGPSDGLATGIRAGAPADVFASASPRWMDAVAEMPGVDSRAVFARNRLVVITPRDNPGRIRGITDLARAGVKLVLASPGVPAGEYARQLFANAELQAAERNVVSNEEDVKGVVQKIALGEADAGIVYSTDVTPAVRSNVFTIEIPAEVNVIASYSIAVVRGSRHEAAARAFVSFVLDEGRGSLGAAGFLPAA